MKSMQSLVLAVVVSALCTPVLASQDSQHQGHHPPEASTPAAKSAAPAPPATAPDKRMAGMDAQLQVMQEMHEKMMAAKTPEQRKAMMAEHMKVMQGSMRMMDDMSRPGPETMQCDMGEQHRQMQKRMQMMQSMMQMMMDRMSEAPSH